MEICGGGDIFEAGWTPRPAMERSTVDEDGCTTVPAPILEALNLHAGVVLDLHAMLGGVALVRPEDKVDQKPRRLATAECAERRCRRRRHRPLAGWLKRLTFVVSSTRHRIMF